MLTVLSTVYDARTRTAKCERNPLLLSFSLYSNASRMFSVSANQPSGEIKCLHGIRVLSTFSIILLHAYYFRVKTFEDDPVYEEWMKSSRWASSVAALNVSADSFLLISAAMTTRSMLKELDL